MAHTTAGWTLADLDRLPDDSNRYELVHGELFVTPPPSCDHEDIASVLSGILHPYVALHRLGRIHHPRSVVRTATSQVEPDITVRPLVAQRPASWSDAPRPILVVEVLSDSTRRRDEVEKRQFYRKTGIPCYWIVDGASRTICVVRPGQDDVVSASAIAWHPDGASEPLLVDVRAVFREALGLG